jgi:hypothetical protein
MALLTTITATTAAKVAVSLREIDKFAKADTSSSQASNRTRDHERIILPLTCTFISLSSTLDPPAFNKIAIPANTEERERAPVSRPFKSFYWMLSYQVAGMGFFDNDAVLGASRSLSGA